ncbi:hypothetical protein GDO81_022533 [Engystomops pustulosus]|uniref:Uncharacterized protein n=1 Tax=Engystomops pustulosus TaxID=76066 RepID=A0AAV6ZAX7_ENGPU|nr:hypothetical protein GDO81_022533 [Engystomops pustulosus]
MNDLLYHVKVFFSKGRGLNDTDLRLLLIGDCCTTIAERPRLFIFLLYVHWSVCQKLKCAPPIGWHRCCFFFVVFLTLLKGMGSHSF